jgi:hypothetical protein
MDAREKRPAFYERHWFQGTVAVVGLVSAIWALAAAPSPWKIVSDLFSTPTAQTNTAIVLDTSAAMGSSFGGETKLVAAQHAIAQYTVARSEEGLSLRNTAGGCGESGERLVDLGADHNDEVREEAAAQQAGGTSNLTHAVVKTIEELANDKSLHESTVRIMVFAGGTDECGIESPAEEIQDALEGTKVEARFRLIALRPSEAEEGQLKEFKEALSQFTNVKLRTPQNGEQLGQDINQERAENPPSDEGGTLTTPEEPETGTSE